MTEIEKALAYWEEFQSEIDGLYYETNKAGRLELDKQRPAVAEAISALQEKIKREKGGEHCNNIAMPPEGGPHEFIILDNGLYYYCSEYGWEGTVIEHCPWCGRPLKGEEE